MNSPPRTLTRAAWSPFKTDAPSEMALAPSATNTPVGDAMVHSSTLFKGLRTVGIAHNGAVYRLQATRQGKLILTK